jgi:hypothetical protein
MKRQDLQALALSKFHDAKRQIGEPKDIQHQFHDGTSCSDLPTNSAYPNLKPEILKQRVL